MQTSYEPDEILLGQEEPHWNNGMNSDDLEFLQDLGNTSVIDSGLNSHLACGLKTYIRADNDRCVDLPEGYVNAIEPWWPGGEDSHHITPAACDTPHDSVMEWTPDKTSIQPHSSTALADLQVWQMELELEQLRTVHRSKHPQAASPFCLSTIPDVHHLADVEMSGPLQQMFDLLPPIYELPTLPRRTMELAAAYREHPQSQAQQELPATRELSRRGSNASSTVRGYRSKGSYPCGECSEVFDLPCDLKHHSRKHMVDADKPYACSDCGHRFLYPKDLRRHRMRKHFRADEIMPDDDTVQTDLPAHSPSSTLRGKGRSLYHRVPSKEPVPGPSRKRKIAAASIEASEDPSEYHHRTQNSATSPQLRLEPDAIHQTRKEASRGEIGHLKHFAPLALSPARIETFAAHQEDAEVPELQVARAYLDGLRTFFTSKAASEKSDQSVRSDLALQCLAEELERWELEALRQKEIEAG